MLDNYRHEFQALIDWMNLQERLKSTDVQNRFCFWSFLHYILDDNIF